MTIDWGDYPPNDRNQAHNPNVGNWSSQASNRLNMLTTNLTLGL